MVRGNLAAAMQGLIALPLLAGYDLNSPDPQTAGRIVSFDAAGGWNMEEEGYQSVGSGSIFAKSSMKKLYSRVTDVEAALAAGIFHRQEVPISEVKDALRADGLETR